MAVPKIKIARADDVAEGETVKFSIPRDGRPLEGFLARYQGKLVAYENRCRHLPVSLDFFEGQFFTQDGQHFVCHNHNALYEPLTGLCTQGPCEGQSLKALPDRSHWMAMCSCDDLSVLPLTPGLSPPIFAAFPKNRLKVFSPGHRKHPRLKQGANEKLPTT